MHFSFHPSSSYICIGDFSLTNIRPIKTGVNSVVLSVVLLKVSQYSFSQIIPNIFNQVFSNLFSIGLTWLSDWSYNCNVFFKEIKYCHATTNRKPWKQYNLITVQFVQSRFYKNKAIPYWQFKVQVKNELNDMALIISFLLIFLFRIIIHLFFVSSSSMWSTAAFIWCSRQLIWPWI